MKHTWTLIAAFALSVAGSAASAATYTFDFDNMSNWDASAKTYTEAGYIFDPIQLQGGHCYDGKCYIETSQGDATILTTDPAGGSFDVISTYFNFQGFPENEFGFTGGGNTVTLTAGESYTSAADGVSIYLASDLSLYTGILEKQVGYFITFDDDQFDGVTSWFSQAISVSQLRIDCVSISTDGSNMTQGGLGACSPTTPPIPLPAAGWLLLGGLGGLAAMGRRRKA